jgi:cyclopropane fatty-acyl-phospholipid synthase-like methyltransferase
MLEAAQLKPGETLYDLGSGDGRIVITAAQMFKANAVGVEISDVGRSGAQERSVAGEPRTKAGC